MTPAARDLIIRLHNCIEKGGRCFDRYKDAVDTCAALREILGESRQAKAMTKERREELRAWALSYLEHDDSDLPVLLREAPNDSDSTYITPAELLALLDADERLEQKQVRIAFSAEEVQLTREAFAAWVGEHDTGGEECAWPEIPVILKKMER